MLSPAEMALLQRAGESLNLGLALDVMGHVAERSPNHIADVVAESAKFVTGAWAAWSDVLARQVPEVLVARHFVTWESGLYDAFLAWAEEDPKAWRAESGQLIDAAHAGDTLRLGRVIASLREQIGLRQYG